MLDKKIYHCKFAFFDLSEFPLIQVTTKVAEPSMEEVEGYQRLKKKIFNQIDEKVIFIFDPSSIKWLSSEARIAMGNGVKYSEKYHSDIIKKAYMVIPNVMANILLKGINLVSNTKFKYTIYKTYTEAYQAAKKDSVMLVSENA